MLYTTDSNDSMKRIIQWKTVPEAPATLEGIAQPILGACSEAKDSQTAGHGVYLTREQVDEWAKEVLMEEVPGFDYNDDNPCAQCWQNMKTELTAKMWEIFEETGPFLALCRHGFVLILVDMVHSSDVSAPLCPTFPPIFLHHLCIFLLIVASSRRSALMAPISESDGHVM